MTTRDKILLSLLIKGGKDSYQSMFSYLPPNYNRQNFYAILRRMEKDQLLTRKQSQDTRIARLQPEGLASLESKYGPRIRRVHNTAKLSPWDNSLLLVTYQFSQGDSYVRNQLQKTLKRLGARPLRRGLYATPYDISRPLTQWAESRGVLNQVFILKTQPLDSNKPLWPQAQNSLLENWKISQLAKKYMSLLDRLKVIKGQQHATKRQSGIKRIKSDFLKLLISDPLLPKPLLPADWPLEPVISNLSTIY